MIAELERAPRTKLENSGPAQKSHNQWEQQQCYPHSFSVIFRFLIVDESDLIRIKLLCYLMSLHYESICELV